MRGKYRCFSQSSFVVSIPSTVFYIATYFGLDICFFTAAHSQICLLFYKRQGRNHFKKYGVDKLRDCHPSKESNHLREGEGDVASHYAMNVTCVDPGGM